MTSEQFAYWMQGFVELTPGMEAPSPEQWESIKQHLQTVFMKVTPPFQKASDSYPRPTSPLDSYRGLQTLPGLPPFQITC